MKTKNIIENIFLSFITIVALVCLGMGFAQNCKRQTTTITSPVKENNIDSLTIKNNTIVIEVEHLESIKNVKTIEVKALDNDSTLKLFYELISQ